MTQDRIQEGDLAEVIGKRFHRIVTINAGAEIQSHKGIIQMDDLIGKPWGSVVKSHNGNTFFILQPALTDLVKHIPRNTQILYPKDIGFVLLSLAVGPGQRIVEAGTGSGALTIAFAHAIGDSGKVFSYDMRPEMQQVAAGNLRRAALESRVELKTRDIAEGFDETNVDALFLDIPNAYDYLSQARAALKPGGFFGSILPTMNQVTQLLSALQSAHFAFTEVCEIMIRYYRTEPDKFRPVDRMVAHTGFLIFARPLTIDAELSAEMGLEAEDYLNSEGIA